MNIEYISSRSNEYIIKCNSFHDKKNRRRDGVFIFEGIKLFTEAAARGVIFESIIYTERCRDIVMQVIKENNSDVRLIEVSEGVYTKLSSEKSPSGIFCVAKAIDKIHKTATIYSSDFSGAKIILSSIQDPGNLGTVIRCASAFGFEEIILDLGCADIYNEKTIRAAMGTLFSAKITRVDDCIQAISELKRVGYEVYGAALYSNSLPLNKLNCSKKTCFVIGNEGHGLDEDVISACTGSVIIPMPGGAESLNASIAASLLMWECIRDNA